MDLHAPSAAPPADLIARLAGAVGPRNVATAAADLEPHLVELRRLFRGEAIAVARPGSTAEVAAVVSACAAAGVPVVPQGGNTGLVGGGVPRGAVVLSLGRLDRVRAVDADNATMTVEAGCILAATCRTRPRRPIFSFPLSPRLRRLLQHRRQHRHQRRRHRRPALRQHARPRPRSRGRAAGRARLGRPARPAQGQHRLRPQAPVHRRRRHARHHHGGGAEALSRARVPSRRPSLGLASDS